jgi:hypothetical protein
MMTFFSCFVVAFEDLAISTPVEMGSVEYILFMETSTCTGSVLSARSNRHSRSNRI